jgi:hypothetical protein
MTHQCSRDERVVLYTFAALGLVAAFDFMPKSDRNPERLNSEPPPYFFNSILY